MFDINQLKLQAPKLNSKSKEYSGQGSPFAIHRMLFNNYVDTIMKIIEEEESKIGYKYNLASLKDEIRGLHYTAIDEIVYLPIEHQWGACLRYKHGLYNAVKHHRILSPYQSDEQMQSEDAKTIRVPKSLVSQLQRLHNVTYVCWFDNGPACV